MFDKFREAATVIFLSCGMVLMLSFTTYMLVYVWFELGRLLAGGC